MKRKIYLASSWRNAEQPAAVALLREQGHDVYDFRNPSPGNNGFAWRQLGGGPASWTLRGYIELLDHPVARAGFKLDKDALDWCDTCVLLLPCGRSAHLEAGYAAGQGKQVFVVLSEKQFEPELMYLLSPDAQLRASGAIVTSVAELTNAMRARIPAVAA